MITIENSNLINWSEYPEYVCAVVLCNNVDVNTSDGLVMPKGTEFIWLLSKIPTQTGASELTICNAKLLCLDGFGLWNGLNSGFCEFLDPLELHIKPCLKSKATSLNYKECEA